MNIITHLEPRFEQAGAILLEENEEVNEILFILTGDVDVGYTIDREVKYVLRFQGRVMLAAYNATFNIRTIAAYRSHTDCAGYSLKKKVWEEIISDD